jgi:hypothetical protein
MGRSYLNQVKRLAPAAARIVDKRPSNFLYAGLIHLMLPRARIIHTRRDPLDTCFSCYSKLFSTGQEFSYDLAELGGYYRSYLSLMAHWRAVLPPDRLLEIDYESVVSDLETNARRLIDFCSLPWDGAFLRFYETVRPVRTASMNQVRRPVSSASVGRWKPFQTQLKPLLDALGGAR